MSWPTVRRHPRSLREAWPHDPEHAYSIERHSGALMTLGDIVLAVLIAAALAALLLHSVDALFL